MYSMVLMAALTTATDMPDFGRRGGCRGCYGGCYGMGWGGCYGMGWGGCYGMGWGGYGMGWGAWGGGYGGYVLSGGMPVLGGYAYSPMTSTWGTPVVASGAMVSPGTTRSFYYSPALANQAQEATLIVNLPAGANLTIDGQPTQSRSARRVFFSPPLEPGKTYTYTLRAEANRDGRFVNAKKTVEVRAGQPTEVTMSFGRANNQEGEEIGAPDPANRRRSRDSTPDR